MLNQDCQQFTTGLAALQNEDRQFLELLSGDFRDTEVDEKREVLSRTIDNIYFDEIEESEQFLFGNAEVSEPYSSMQTDSVGRTSFEFSPNGQVYALQTDYNAVQIINNGGGLINTFTVGRDCLIRSFYFPSDEQFVINYFYDDIDDGPSRAIGHYVVDGRNSRMIMTDKKTKGEIFVNGPQNHKYIYRPNQPIREQIGSKEYVVPGWGSVDKLDYMKIVGGFLVCQTDQELFCIEIDSDMTGLAYHKDTFASAVYGTKIAFVDYFDDCLKVRDLATGQEERIMDHQEEFAWKICFDKTGQNLLAVNSKGIVRVYNIAQKRIISHFRSINGEEFYPTQIGYTMGDRIIVSGGFIERKTKLFTLPGLKKYQSNLT